MEHMYPLSVVTDDIGINVTVVSYMSKLCFAITSCPTEQPGIGVMGRLIEKNYKALQDATVAL
jgi:hypothetical protein